MIYRALCSLLFTSSVIQPTHCYGMEADSDDTRIRPGKRGFDQRNSSSAVSREGIDYLTLGSFAALPFEIIGAVIARSPFQVIGVNKSFYFLATGYATPGAVGKESIPGDLDKSFGNPQWGGAVDFARLMTKGVDQAYLKSVTFYRFTKEIWRLPVSRFVYLQGTNVHTLILDCNQIGDDDLRGMQLQGTNVHTLDLSWNLFSDVGVREMPLTDTKVQAMDLSGNDISEVTHQYLRKTYPHISFTF